MKLMYFGTIDGFNYGWFRLPVFRCVPVSEAEYRRLMALNRKGKKIIPNENGFPQAVDN